MPGGIKRSDPVIVAIAALSPLPYEPHQLCLINDDPNVRHGVRHGVRRGV
eukprot:CAMPEP_0170288750 /NCGR_PEP_ID=MMETSP0116_2-20130129/44437_1 /TAXON_ID=400756 /ORGANISM="Durinskia baltica, Strain CSIRO CS-38" /LENGTH=49 /DNA_ID= /DNA_START= /DNA_END= /DNA_ORIENTATION=